MSRRGRWSRRYTAQSPHIANIKRIECKLKETFGTAMCEFAACDIIFSTRSSEAKMFETNSWSALSYLGRGRVRPKWSWNGFCNSLTVCSSSSPFTVMSLPVQSFCLWAKCVGTRPQNSAKACRKFLQDCREAESPPNPLKILNMDFSWD